MSERANQLIRAKLESTYLDDKPPKPKRGLASFTRGDRVHHEKRGKGTVHYVGTAPGLRGRPMTSVVWDGPGGLLGPEPIFHGSGLAKGLRRLKEAEEKLGEGEYVPQTPEQRKAIEAHIGAFEGHLEKLVGGRHVMSAASSGAGHPWLPHAHMTVGQDPEQSAARYHASTKPFWDRMKIKGDKLKAKWDRQDARRDRAAAR